VVTDNRAGLPFRISGCYGGGITDAGIKLQSDIGMLEWFMGICGTTDTGLDMIACPTESRIADLHVEGDPADRRKQKRIPLMIDFPVAPRSRMTGLALQKKFDKSGFIGFQHGKQRLL